MKVVIVGRGPSAYDKVWITRDDGGTTVGGVIHVTHDLRHLVVEWLYRFDDGVWPSRTGDRAGFDAERHDRVSGVRRVWERGGKLVRSGVVGDLGDLAAISSHGHAEDAELALLVAVVEEGGRVVTVVRASEGGREYLGAGFARTEDDEAAATFFVGAQAAVDVDPPEISNAAHHHEGEDSAGEHGRAGEDCGLRSTLHMKRTAVVSAVARASAATSSKLPKRQRPR